MSEIKESHENMEVESLQIPVQIEVPQGYNQNDAEKTFEDVMGKFLKGDISEPQVGEPEEYKREKPNMEIDFNNNPFDVWIDECRAPVEHGTWEGKKGESTWIPDPDYIPPEKSNYPETKPYSNPDNLTWEELLKKYGIDGIPFKDGFPVFDEVAKATVTIEGFETGGTAEKNRNFKRADMALAEERGCSPADVEKWRKENNYTWHECEDKKTMQKVPNEIHANVPHDGGRSQHDDTEKGENKQ